MCSFFWFRAEETSEADFRKGESEGARNPAKFRQKMVNKRNPPLSDGEAGIEANAPSKLRHKDEKVDDGCIYISSAFGLSKRLGFWNDGTTSADAFG